MINYIQTNMNNYNKSMPKKIRHILDQVASKKSLVKVPSNDESDSLQSYHDKILEIYKRAFMDLIGSLTTFSSILQEIKDAYDRALQCRDNRISMFVTQDRIYGISAKKKERDETIKKLVKEIEDLREQNLKLNLEMHKVKRQMGELVASRSSDAMCLFREREVRYTLYAENVQLHCKLQALDGSTPNTDDACADPVMLRIALQKCREVLTATQSELLRLKLQYSESVPRAEYDQVESARQQAEDQLAGLQVEHQALLDTHRKVKASKLALEEELSEVKERCSELERAGTPRPQWEICADFISGGTNRWWQLASGLSSRDRLRVLLKELGPAAESEHLEFFDPLGSDPVIPAYLRHSGRVRNLRLSRRELSVIITDIWRSKRAHRDVTLQDYLTSYFQERYQQPSVRAEWAYNLCAGAEQMLDDPQIKLFWGILHGQVSEEVYWGLRDHWTRLRDQLYKCSADGETVTMDELEKAARAVFPLKSEVDIRALSDVVRKQLKLKLGATTVMLDRLFQENEEGFDRSELSRELYRQRRVAQDRYLREVIAELGGRAAADKAVTVDAVKRAFAVLDPAIDHIRMERHIRWAFSLPPSHSGGGGGLPAGGLTATLRTIAARLAAADIERVGPRTRTRHHRRTHHK